MKVRAVLEKLIFEIRELRRYLSREYDVRNARTVIVQTSDGYRDRVFLEVSWTPHGLIVAKEGGLIDTRGPVTYLSIPTHGLRFRGSSE